MNRTIDWQRTGGKSHRVTITDYRQVATHPLMNIYGSVEYGRLMNQFGAQASPHSSHSSMQQQAANAYSPADAGFVASVGGIL